MTEVALTIPPQAITSLGPVTLAAPDRGDDLQVRVTAPVHGASLPVIIFSHGFHESMDSYQPLATYWASHGFAVVQPTHLDSLSLHLDPDDPRVPLTWYYRENDIALILDNLDQLQRTVPGLAGRLDLNRVAVAGHSWGATTVSAFLGATHPDTRNSSTVVRRETRVKAGVLLALAGTGGGNLTPFAAETFGFMHPDFSGMDAPALIVAGGADQSRLSLVGPEWWREGYDQSPAPKALFTSTGGEHSLGGIAGYNRTDTTDENSKRVEVIQRLSLAFLKTALYADDKSWEKEVRSFADKADVGRIESRF